MARGRFHGDRWWKVMRLKEQCQHYLKRSLRNRCGVAYRHLRRALIHQTKGRRLKVYATNILRNQRLEAACDEHEIGHRRFKRGLNKSGVTLNQHMLNILSMYEPRTFERLVELAERTEIETVRGVHEPLPERRFSANKINI
uniref:39S ribosomal protein L20, mitochondrial-like n=1 Tax=Phallusia mammillata TaxID=59560 RepID=A0A6F9DM18_9ASCI|nr:39S ribosomal protein L20, mitochondrial-like [Phallusia mammillata]